MEQFEPSSPLVASLEAMQLLPPTCARPAWMGFVLFQRRIKSSQVNCLLHQWHLECYLDCARTRPRTLLGARPLSDVGRDRSQSLRTARPCCLFAIWRLMWGDVGFPILLGGVFLSDTYPDVF